MLDLKSVQRLGGRKGMAASGLDLPCTGSSRTHLWLFAPALLPTYLSHARLREGGQACVYQGRVGYYGISGTGNMPPAPGLRRRNCFFFLVCVIFLGWEYFEEREIR